jgi:hypothetical protein
MIIKGQKIICSSPNGRSLVELKYHSDPILDNIITVNSLKSKKYQDVWIIDIDLERWLSKLEKEGYTEIKIEKNVDPFEKNKRKK